MAHSGTVAQTLASVTQSSTGETTFFSTVSAATLSEVLNASFSQETTHSATLTEEIIYGEVFSVTAVANLTNTVEYYSQIDYSNVLTGDEIIAGIEWTTSVTPTGANIASEVEHYVTLPIDQVLNASNVVTDSVTTESTHVLVASNVVEPSAQFNVTATSTLTVTNTYEAGIFETVTDVITASEVPSVTVDQNEVTAHTVIASELQTGILHTFEELLSAATVTESITFNGSVANNTVEDTGYVKDNVWANDFGALAWVLNTETGGTMSYDNYGFDSLAFFNNTLYATSPEGIFSIAADTDNGRFISAEVELGFLDFGTAQTKRLSDMYIGYTGGQLQVDVETYDGPQEVYTYDMEERDADAPRNNRIKIGKGLSSRYWRFKFKNVDGADFQIYDLSAVVGISNRRL